MAVVAIAEVAASYLAASYLAAIASLVVTCPLVAAYPLVVACPLAAFPLATSKNASSQTGLGHVEPVSRSSNDGGKHCYLY